MCECDRGLAYRLRDHEDSWDLKFHRKWWSPGFDYKECEVPRKLSQNLGHSGNNGVGNNQNHISEKKCCGDYKNNGLRFPFETLGGYRGCCGRKTYDVGTMECCDEGFSEVSARGAC